MTQNIIEYLRQESVNRLFMAKGFKKNWETWQAKILEFIPSKTPSQIFNLGDHLYEVFYSTREAGRSQSTLSGGGASWESLICWYLNLCLIGRRTVVIKHNKNLIPTPVSNAITVNYGNFISNTESDLIAITFPERIEYEIDKNLINVYDSDNNKVENKIKNKFNLIGVLSALTHRDFTDLEIHIIQCKTNWNDNAQIPMLWDMVYSAKDFRNGITIGRNGYSIHDVSRFTYSFVTVPTVKIENFKTTSTAVKRVCNLSGGNYWGRDTVTNISSSVKEMLSRNLSNGHSYNHLTTLKNELPKLSTKYSYFKI